jgi:stress response protein YsnF
MTYGQGGYRQPDLRPGMHVQTDTGWAGQIVEVIPAPPGYDGTVRVSWQGYGTTDVTASSFTVENGVAWIRSQPPAQHSQPQAPQPAAQQTMPLDAAPDDDMATQLANPARPETSHVNPYAGNEPLVTDEPAPVHTAGGGQESQHVNPFLSDQPVVAPEPPPVAPAMGGQADPDATILPPAPRQVPATDPDATVLPSGRSPASESGYRQPYNDQSDATVLASPITPESADTQPGAAQRDVTVPVTEEQVAAHAEWRDAGAINVRTVMEEVPQTLSQETQRDEVFVERVAVGRVLEDGEEVSQREEDGVTIIPVIVEEAVVVVRRVLAEELRITKRTIPTVQTLQTVVRKERVEFDGGELADRVHDGTNGTDTDAADTPSQAARGKDTA